MVAAIGTSKEPLASITESLTQLESTVRCTDQRLAAIREELVTLDGQAIDKENVAAALAQFDGLWEVLYPQEKVRIVNLLVERVVYNTLAGEIRIYLHQVGIKTLAHQTASWPRTRVLHRNGCEETMK